MVFHIRGVAQSVHLDVAKPLRAPHEIRQAKEVTVFGEVVLGVGVPPAAVGNHCLRIADQPLTTLMVPSAASARW